MKILVTGGTGFIGRMLVARLLGAGHQVRVWTRSVHGARSTLGADVELMAADDAPARYDEAVEGCGAVINLAGAGIADQRWSEARKKELIDSRVALTRGIVDAIGRSARPPRTMVSASAVGYYQDAGSERLYEDSPRGRGFLADLCAEWEDAAVGAKAHGVRVAMIRIGVVLGREGGALAKMLPPFKAGLGGRLGSGKQYMPWIHVFDLVEMMMTCLVDERFEGPINGVAPDPVTNAEFTRQLGKALGRPTIFPVPKIALQTILGQAAEIMLKSQRVIPQRANEAGFNFRFPTLDRALNDVVEPSEGLAIRPFEGGPRSDYLDRRRPTHVLEQVTWIDAPREEVFEFFSKPSNLGLMTPPSLSFEMKTPDVKVEQGARLAYRIGLGPIPMGWTTEIVDWSPRLRFVDAQESGPYRCWWHEHIFEDHGDRTMMIDRVFYSVPLGPIGRIVNRLFVAPKLKEIFSYRASITELRFGQSEPTRRNVAA